MTPQYLIADHSASKTREYYRDAITIGELPREFIGAALVEATGNIRQLLGLAEMKTISFGEKTLRKLSTADKILLKGGPHERLLNLLGDDMPLSFCPIVAKAAGDAA